MRSWLSWSIELDDSYIGFIIYVNLDWCRITGIDLDICSMVYNVIKGHMTKRVFLLGVSMCRIVTVRAGSLWRTLIIQVRNTGICVRSVKQIVTYRYDTRDVTNCFIVFPCYIRDYPEFTIYCPCIVFTMTAWSFWNILNHAYHGLSFISFIISYAIHIHGHGVIMVGITTGSVSVTTYSLWPP